MKKAEPALVSLHYKERRGIILPVMSSRTHDSASSMLSFSLIRQTVRQSGSVNSY